MPFEQRLAGAEFGENLVFGHGGEAAFRCSAQPGRAGGTDALAGLSKILPRSA